MEEKGRIDEDKIRQGMNTIQNLLREEDKVRKRTRMIRLAFTLGIIVLFVIYGWSICSSTAKRFSQERVLQVVEKEVRGLSPEITRAAEDIIKEVVPVYSDVFLTKFEQMQPRLNEAAAREGALFREHTATYVATKLESGIRETFEKQIATLLVRVPGLDEVRAAEVINNVITVSEEELSKLVGERLLSSHIMTINEIGQVLLEFDISGITVSGDDLIALLEHKLLEYAVLKLKAQVAAL